MPLEECRHVFFAYEFPTIRLRKSLFNSRTLVVAQSIDIRLLPLNLHNYPRKLRLRLFGPSGHSLKQSLKSLVHDGTIADRMP